MTALRNRLRALPLARLAGIRRGIEKESLRALPGGGLALTPHPAALGSALTHPHITTDYSESQLELITGVHASVDAALAELTEIHQATYRAMGTGPGDEQLWVGSMPCGLPTDETIPLGRYGSQQCGPRQERLPHGPGPPLWPAHADHLRHPLQLVAAGAGQRPALCADPQFPPPCLCAAVPVWCLARRCAAALWPGASTSLQPMPGVHSGNGTLHMPYGTTLRMGRLGYQSEAQASLNVSCNSLESYANSLHEALTRPYPAYEAVGVRNPGGDYNQLATTLLQIENEFYGLIRPKRVIFPGERPLHALRERGVEYIEVRCMDLDPFEPVGIATPTMRFIDVFLLHCLLADSPPDTPAEVAALGRNQHRVAARGREPGLLLEQGEHTITLTDWARELLDECVPIAEALDAAQGGEANAAALAAARALLDTPEQLPSARVLQAMTAGLRRQLCAASSAPSRRPPASICWPCPGRMPRRRAMPRWRPNRWRRSSTSRRPTPCPSSNTAKPICRPTACSRAR